MSDMHFGKETTTFNPNVFINRLDRCGKALERIHSLLSDYEFSELVFAIPGDANDGTGIYPTQTFHQEINNVEEQAYLLSHILADFFVWQKRVWGNVRVEGVPGNHGRGGKFIHEAANWDMVLYHFLGLRLKEHSIPVNINDKGNPFIRKIQLRNHNYLLYHGHGIRMYQQIPWYGISQRILRWHNSSLAPFETVLMGHFHTCQMVTVNKVSIFLSGTPVTSDDWALQELGAESEPRWWLFGVSDSRPVTWRFALDLD
jgi:DNA polymerase II small subunit/DNA polymerase delta subunit B